MNLVRRRALGDVVLLGAVTAALGGVTVVTDPRYVPLAARLRGVVRAVPLGTPVEGPVVDLQRDLVTLRAFPWARRLRKHSLVRRLRLAGVRAARRDVAEIYGRACGVTPVAPPWIETGGAAREGLALIPGASVRLKRARPDLLVAIGRRWRGNVVIAGGPGDAAAVQAVADQVPGATSVVEDGFDRTVEAFGACRVAVGGDTGLLHLAIATGAQGVVVLGPTHEDDGFWPYAAARVGLDLSCRPCALHRVDHCRMGHERCLGVDVESVWREVESCTGSS
jgi:hypothetical protein